MLALRPGLWIGGGGNHRVVDRPVVSDVFFAGRRRHTMWTGDWSSDVCSSDLSVLAGRKARRRRRQFRRGGPLGRRHCTARRRTARGSRRRLELARLRFSWQARDRERRREAPRSEERRGGKEGRLCWWAVFQSG